MYFRLKASLLLSLLTIPSAKASFCDLNFIQRLLSPKHSFPTFRLFEFKSQYSDPIALLENIHGKYGDFAALQIPGFKPIVFVGDPKVAKEILRQTSSAQGGFEKSELQKAPISLVMGRENVFNSSGDTWKRQRRLIQPFFSPQATKSGPIYSKMTQAIDEKLNYVAQSLKGSKSVELNMSQFAGEATLEAFTKTYFDIPLTFDESRQLNTALKTVFNEGVNLTKSSAIQTVTGLRKLFVDKKFRPKRLKAQFKVFDDFIARVIALQKQKGENDSLLSRIVFAKDERGVPVSEQEVRDQVSLMLIAGYETTGNTISWAMQSILSNTAVRDKLTTEIKRSFPQGVASVEDLLKAPFLDQVWNETLRMYPPLFSMTRKAMKDVNLTSSSGQSITIPTGSTVVVSPYITQRKPAQLPNVSSSDPSVFDPERFAEIHSGIDKELLSFGAGPRICPGMYFAENEAKYMIVRLLSRFQISPAKAIPPKPIGTGTTQMSEDFKIKLSSRGP